MPAITFRHIGPKRQLLAAAAAAALACGRTAPAAPPSAQTGAKDATAVVWKQDGAFRSRSHVDGGWTAATPLDAARVRGWRTTSIWNPETGRSAVYTSAYDAGAWLPAERQNANALRAAYWPGIATNAGGDAVLVWEEEGEGPVSPSLYARVFDGAWSEPREIDGAPGDVSYGDVAIDGAGDAVAAWTQHDGGGWTVRAARYDASTSTWATPAWLSAGLSGDEDFVRVAMDMDGEALVVLRASDGLRDRVYAVGSAGAGWSAPVLMVDAETNAESPTVAMNNAGDAIVAWYRYVNDPGGRTAQLWIEARRLDAARGWDDGAVEVWSGTVATPLDPQVRAEVSDSGEAVVVWQSGRVVHAATSRGGAWDPPVELEDVAATNEVALVTSGVAIAEWTETVSGARWSTCWQLPLR